MIANNIKDFVNMKAFTQKRFQSYCADKTKPIAERWTLFCDAPDELKNIEYEIIEPEQDLNFLNNIAWRDYFSVSRFKTYYLNNDFIERIQEVYTLTPAEVPQLQEWILERCLGSFVYDW